MDQSPLTNVALILPTLNNGVEMAKHLDALEPIIHEFGQIIAVDSYSEDGTYALLKERLPKNAIIEQRPKGLYQCWNYALGLAEVPYSYISTIGDLANCELLKEMAVFTLENDLDIVVSPPKFVYQNDKQRNKPLWPIHFFIQKLEIKGNYIFPSDFLNDIQAVNLVKFGNSSIFGSMASNLVKTDLCHKFLFPTEFSGIGDVLWAAEVINKGKKVGLFNKNVSIFLIHEKSYAKLTNNQQTELTNLLINNIFDSIDDRNVAQLLIEITELRKLLKYLREDLWIKIIAKSYRQRIKAKMKEKEKHILKRLLDE